MTIGLISHPTCALHLKEVPHPEKSERVLVIANALKHYPFKARTQFYEAPLITKEALYKVHDKDYVDWIFSIAPQNEIISLDADTFMDPTTLEAALHAAGAVSYAVDLVMKKEIEVAFCNIRPPGHHAEYDKAMGFCFFNNVAIGVRHALENYGLKRIAIIDFDVHHGNGSQDIFQDESRVLLCSSFEHPFYPGYDKKLDNEHILNVPLSAGTDGKIFRSAVEKAWFSKLQAFKPEFIFFSAGFDAHANDPLADLRLKDEDYVWLTDEIAKLAKEYAQGRMVSVLEGGYNLEVLAECVPKHVNAMAL